MTDDREPAFFFPTDQLFQRDRYRVLVDGRERDDYRVFLEQRPNPDDVRVMVYFDRLTFAERCSVQIVKKP